MNEILFILQIVLILAFVLGAWKLGKGALITWVTVQALVANLFVLKQITLFGLHVTASDAFIVGSLLGLNFLQEHFGKDEAQKATRICFFFMFFFTIISQVHLFYQPSIHDTTHSAFEAILAPSPRLLIASTAVFLLVQQIDIRFFEFLKKSAPKLNFGIRASIALVVSQLLDTVLFSFAGLYGVVASMIDIIVVSLLIKLIVISCCSVCLKWVRA